MTNNRRENQQGKVNTSRKTGDDLGQKRVKTIPINRPEEGGQKRVKRITDPTQKRGQRRVRRPPGNKGKSTQ